MTTAINDDQMKQLLSQAKGYTVVILHKTEKFREPGMEKVVWEHGKRNFQLKADGLLSIVCAIRDESDVSGVGIFNATPEETRKIYEEDPGVKAGIFTFEVHACSSFPGSSLPK